MSEVARNTGHYSVGIPTIWFYAVPDRDDPQAVDAIALGRAFAGIREPASGYVLNGQDQSVCLTPEEVMKAAYIGNITTSGVGGEITTLDHTASVEGRQEVDKRVLIRRSLQYTLGFDELNANNLDRLFAAQRIFHPVSETVMAASTQKSPQTGAANFSAAQLELVTSGMTSVGVNSAAFEGTLTEALKKRNTSFTPYDDSGTPYYLAGVYYFMVGNSEQYSTVDGALEKYRNKIMAGYFKYDQPSGEMKLQVWPTGMDTADIKYVAADFDPRLRIVNLTGAETSAGVGTNNTIIDSPSASSIMQTASWAVDEANVATHTLTVTLPGNILHNSVRVQISGQKFNGTSSLWERTTENLYDMTMAPDAANGVSPLRTAADDSYFTDNTGTEVNYEAGTIQFTVGAQLLLDAAANALAVQTLEIVMSAYSAEGNKFIWNGIIWAVDNDTQSVLRVNRGQKEVEGCALVVFQNEVGASYIHFLPYVSFRPDGTVDFAKDDWMAGSFVMDVIKDADASIPNLNKRILTPFGWMICYRYRNYSKM